MAYRSRYKKKLRRYNVGGFLKDNAQIIGTGVGAGIGAFAGNPMLGAKIGGGVGGMVQNAGEGGEQVNPYQQHTIYGRSNLGYKYGGKMYRNGGDLPTLRSFIKQLRSAQGRDRSQIRTPRTSERPARGARKVRGSVQSKGRTSNTAREPRKTGSYRGGGHLKKYQAGGMPITQPIGPDAERYEGPAHEQGGIPINEQGQPDGNQPIAEVEGGETRQGDYIFSDELTVPGTEYTFAQAHEMMLEEGAQDQEIEELAALQEQVQQEEGVAGGDDAQPNTDGGVTDQAIAESYKGATEGRGEPVGMTYQFGGRYTRWADRQVNQNLSKTVEQERKYAGGGYLNKYQTGGDLEPYNLRKANVPKQRGSFGPAGDKEFDVDKAMGIASYVVPSATRAGIALGMDKPKPTRKIKPREIPTTSPALRKSRQDVAKNYRTVTSDPNLTSNQKLAAQAQYISGRSDIGAQEAEYAQQAEAQNVQTGMQTDQLNLQSEMRDQERIDRDKGARVSMLAEAAEMPITRYQKDKATEQQAISQAVMAANSISDPVNRAETLRANLRAIGLSGSRVEEIMREYEMRYGGKLKKVS